MEQKAVRLAIMQISSIIGDIDLNIKKVIKIIENNSLSDIDVLVMPEVWTCGWSCENFIKTAEDINNSQTIEFLKKIATENKINIIGGSLISKQNGKFYNTCPVIDKKGELVAIYNKNHLYSYYGCNEEEYVERGDSPVMVELDGVKYGLTICYDIRFPEIYRAYRLAGADILINCAAWGASKPIPWEMMTKSRAIENQCYMVALTQCGKISEGEYNLGHSRIIDYKGEELNSIFAEEGIISSELNLNEMYEFREKCTILKDIKNNYEVKTLCIK